MWNESFFSAPQLKRDPLGSGSLDTVQNSGTYMLQWPPWVGGIIALGLMAASYSAVAEGVRRRYGRKAVWVAAFIAAVGLGTFVAVAMFRAAELPKPVWGLLTLVVVVTAMFFAPAFGVSLGARRGSPTLARQVGFGLLAAYGFAACALILTLIIGALVRG